MRGGAEARGKVGLTRAVVAREDVGCCLTLFTASCWIIEIILVNNNINIHVHVHVHVYTSGILQSCNVGLSKTKYQNS